MVLIRILMMQVCNATFKTKANLLNHQLLHTGVKKFTCEICKQKFAHKTSLTLHMRLHT
ncbi:jg24094, partial [Pararge aegeria aegeria]